MSDKAKKQSNSEANVEEIETEEEIGSENRKTGDRVIKTEEERISYQIWLEESDPDDVDYVVHEENCECKEKNTDEEDETSSEEDETESEADEEEKGTDKKAKGKKNKSIEDEEDIYERFEFEVEEEVSRFVDELSIGRKQIPLDDGDEDMGQVPFRDRRIRRRKIEKLVVGHSFLTAVEFKESVLDYAMSTGRNVKQQRWEQNKLDFKCGIKGKCKWRVYCSYDKPRQMWVVKTTFLYSKW